MKNVGIRLTWRQIHKNRSSCDPLPDGSIFIVQGKDKPPAGWYWAWLARAVMLSPARAAKRTMRFFPVKRPVNRLRMFSSTLFGRHMRLLLDNAQKIMFGLVAKRSDLSVPDWLVSLGVSEVDRLGVSSNDGLMAEFGRQLWGVKEVPVSLPPSEEAAVSPLVSGDEQVRCIHCLSYKEPGAFSD